VVLLFRFSQQEFRYSMTFKLTIAYLPLERLAPPQHIQIAR
jgi:hypothetical protein